MARTGPGKLGNGLAGRDGPRLAARLHGINASGDKRGGRGGPHLPGSLMPRPQAVRVAPGGECRQMPGSGSR